MKKTTLIFLCLILAGSVSAQTSVEYFETEVSESTRFTDNGVIFKILSHKSTFDIGYYPPTGWNGTAADNRYIDNTGSVAENASFSIKTTSNLFKANRFWVYVANQYMNQNATGTLTVTGKLNGTTLFTETKISGFANSISENNGYTLIDLAILNNHNNSNNVIDELMITLGGQYQYVGLDAFTWVKDARTVLPVSFGAVTARLKNNRLQVNWETETETNNDHFEIEASHDGTTFQRIATVASKAPDGNSHASLNYEWVSPSAVSLAALPVIAFLLLSLTGLRRKANRIFMLAAITGIMAPGTSCTKNETVLSAGETYYIRLVQVDTDGTATASKIIKVVSE